MQLWPVEDLIDVVCDHVTRNLTAEQWHNQYYVEEPLPQACKALPQDSRWSKRPRCH
jgi:hypothetical protein